MSGLTALQKQFSKHVYVLVECAERRQTAQTGYIFLATTLAELRKMNDTIRKKRTVDYARHGHIVARGEGSPPPELRESLEDYVRRLNATIQH
ncbi:hypothetical protein GC177_02700 [bacterium]|nr:hypothetical protein [bacterium]